MVKNKNIKQKQYCNKFNKDFENGPRKKKKISKKKSWFNLKSPDGQGLSLPTISFPAPKPDPQSSQSQRHSQGKLRMEHSPFPRSAPTPPAHRHKKATKEIAGSPGPRQNGEPPQSSRQLQKQVLAPSPGVSRSSQLASCWLFLLGSRWGPGAVVYQGPKEGWGWGQ